MKRTNLEKGITLIALIITIVVLLILAVVTINSIQGDGIIQYASNAADEYTAKANQEQANLNTLLSQIEGSLITWTKTSDGDLAVESTVVTSTGENFYVIGFKDNNETVVLLAKDNIDTTNLVQSASAEPIAFCEDSVAGYWGNSTGDIKEEVQPIPSTHTAAYAADRYGAKLGVTGRLMTYSEAKAMDDYVRDVELPSNNDWSMGSIFYGRSGTSYWVGAAFDANFLYGVIGPGDNYFDIYEYAETLCGVRPVIEISISKIS